MVAPTASPVIPGTEGVRKLRFAKGRDSKGKSGGYRIFYVYFPEFGTVLLLSVLAKSEKSDLSKADEKALAQVVQHIKTLLNSRRVR